MDSKLDSNKDEKSNVTENDASKVETSRIKLFVGVIAVAIAITTAIASALVNRPQRDDVVILTPPADSSQADKVDNSGSEKVISKTAKAHTTKKAVTSKAVTSSIAETKEEYSFPADINKADAQEISDKLLIDMDKANAVIELRELISYYESPNELLLCKGFTEKLVSELWDYIEI